MTMARHWRAWFLVLCAALAAVLTQAASSAQGGAQFWVRAFEDRNGNGVRDSGEPLLMSGIAVHLRDADGVIIQTALLDDSPNAAQGLIGFFDLEPGTYTALITSPEFEATTPNEVTRTVEAGGVPTVVEFGAQRIEFTPPAPERAPGLFGLPIVLGEREQVGRVALGLFGAAVVICIMIALGMLVYLAVLRPRYRAELREARAGQTGEFRPL
jgi:hypothetical protein